MTPCDVKSIFERDRRADLLYVFAYFLFGFEAPEPGNLCSCQSPFTAEATCLHVLAMLAMVFEVCFLMPCEEGAFSLVKVNFDLTDKGLDCIQEIGCGPWLRCFLSFLSFL